MKRRLPNLSLHSTVFDQLDQELPIKLKELEPIFDRMVEQYPAADKYQMVLVIKAFLEELRKQVLAGKSIHILDFVNGMNLRAGVRLSRFDPKKQKLLYLIRLRSNTPESLK